MQRYKGKAGERELAGVIRDLTGWDVRRRVRQHEGDSDLVGVPGWAVECKRHRAATRGDLAAWWRQAVAQAGEARPVLFYRLDRDSWRAVWTLSVSLNSPAPWAGYEWTVEGSVDAWAAVARDLLERTESIRQPSWGGGPNGTKSCTLTEVQARKGLNTMSARARSWVRLVGCAGFAMYFAYPIFSGRFWTTRLECRVCIRDQLWNGFAFFGYYIAGVLVLAALMPERRPENGEPLFVGTRSDVLRSGLLWVSLMSILMTAGFLDWRRWESFLW